MSESDYPFEVVLWEPPVSTQSVAAVGADAASSTPLDSAAIVPPIFLANVPAAEAAPVQIVEPNEFFRVAVQVQDWHDEAEQAIAQRYRQLLDLLQTKLADLKVYRIGEIEISIYIIGKTSNGTLAGLKTIAIET